MGDEDPVVVESGPGPDVEPGTQHILHFEIKNIFHNQRYGNYAVDSAAKFSTIEN